MITRLIGAICFTVVLSNLALSQDWPQILGPQRNGVAEGESLLKDWPKDNLEQLWEKSVGQGYAGPVVQDDSVVIFHRVDDQNVCERLNAQTGEEIWRVEFAAEYAGGGIDADLGPKAVPVIQDGAVVLYDPSGMLYCLEFETGAKRWERSALKDYRGREGYFGAGSSPLIADGKVIVNVGGREAALVAFGLDDGEEVWKSIDDQPSYSSPVLSADRQTVYAVTRFKAVSVNVADGKVNFEVPFGRRGPTVNAAMPVLVDGHLFVNAAYQVGARWLQLSEEGDPTVVWENDETFSSQYSTPLFSDGNFFGTAGREDFDNGTFRCFDAKSGEVKWKKAMPVGHSILVGKQIIHIDSQSQLRIIEASSEKYSEEYSTKLFDGPTRCIPALSRGRLFVRSNAVGNKGKLVCFVIGPDATEEGR